MLLKKRFGIKSENLDMKIPVSRPWLAGNELKYLTDCVKTNWISSGGKYVVRFEISFSKFCRSPFGVATANGTVALHLALVTLNISRKDEVILPTLTFIATANAVSYVGAKPVFIDSEPYTWNIDPEKIEKKITKNTKAIIAVHLYGHPCNIDPIIDIARRHHLYVIEDAAEAHGALYKGRLVGSIGDIGIFSFYGNKIITTGEGGMLLMENPKWYERARLLRDHAMSKKKPYYHSEIGYNYRMTNLQAAVGLAQMERINKILDRKRQNAIIYHRLLKDVKGLELAPEARWAKSVYWMYSILVNSDFGLTRDQLISRLMAKGIQTRPFFIPLHLLPPYRDGSRFPVAEDIAHRGLNLPSAADLREEEIDFVCRTIKACSKRGAR